MPTTYPNAVQFAAGNASGSAAANAAYNDLPLLTVAVLARFSGATNSGLWSKGNSSDGLWANLFNDGGDLRVARSGNAGLWRGNAITANNTWRWSFWTLNRSTGIHTRIAGPKGGTMASVGPTDTNAGSGTVLSDAAFPFTVGSNGSNTSATVVQIACVAIYDAVLTTAQAQAVADDLLDAGSPVPVSLWRPSAGTTTSVPNGISGRPALALSNTTIVTGPDVEAPVYAGIVIQSNPNTDPIPSFPWPLEPIVVRKVDQFGDPFTGGPTTVSVSEFSLPYDLAGTLTETFVGADATFGDLTAIEAAAALSPPAITLGTATDATGTRTQALTVATSGAAWVAGTTVQLQTRRGSAAFANQGSPITSSGSLVFTREATAYTVDVRGIASAPGATTSAPGAVVTVTVPALSATPWATPVIVLGSPVDATSTRTVPVTATAPSGASVQMQSRRGAAPFAALGTPFAASSSLVFARESADYTVDLRAVSTGGSNPDSAPTTVQTITVPALAVTPTLAAPVLSTGSPTDATGTRTIPFTASSSGAAWIAGTTVQLQTRRGSDPFANAGSPITGTGSLAFPREAEAYTIDVRGIASATGANTSAAGTAITVTIPALAPVALAAPLITVGVLTGTPTATIAPITVASSGAVWPVGVSVAVEQRKNSGSWVSAGPAIVGSGALLFLRESSSYTISLRGVASAPGATSSATSEPVTFTVPALAASVSSTLTLGWALEVFPVAQTDTLSRTLLKDSRNAFVVRDITDRETDTYVTADSVTWALLDGADVVLSGTTTDSNDGWRGEIVLDPSLPLGNALSLDITATADSATWTRRYPITLTAQE